ncbi:MULTISPECIES: molybdenum cofactor biosynthesis protein B [Marinobacter]|uniref:Molybdenum cofactor biosynthesis protein B n=1 Tax=Marinobacter xiaoshiensis TaxID=3073652 RepID=A0ABU2HDB1_9GAMM|nr:MULTISPECIES: molybdenum cofactor biosynthesis protein B [unclassified Marinobacter]MBK1873992.1 molybdenum cofactor biosynthesis protein B [Marinobacter sp. 1-3A]MBK1887970.1 molybdenum cofactor biosynthesis protein B [Marinobacter sp. DY40_1A1]MDS1308600.1 molybdenum cofactor biosynthesis protein B [Marinobacter sp. F60267]
MSSELTSKLKPLNIAILTVSDTRGFDEDSSGQFLEDSVVEAGHKLISRRILPDDIYLVRAAMSSWIADADVHVVIITGGTGFYERDSTPEAVAPLLDKRIEGFGEEFRRLSASEIGSSTIQSRAFGGLANHTAIFCLPGSTGACRTGWNGILSSQLDSRHGPCNFSSLVGRKPERAIERLQEVIGNRAER